MDATDLTERLRLARCLRETRIRLAETDRHLSEIYGSLSWQLTRPLRDIGRRWPTANYYLQAFLKAVYWCCKGELPVRIQGWRASSRRGQRAKNDPERTREELAAGTLVTVAAGGAPTLLFCDENFPDPERSAGDRSSFWILKGLKKAGFQIYLWCPRPIEEYTDCAILVSLDINLVAARSFLTFEEWMKANGSSFDYIFISRPNLARKLLPLVLTTSLGKIIFYGHDLHNARLEAEAALSGNPHLRDAAVHMQQHERAIWRVVDTVLYPSEDEAKIVQQLEPGVVARAIKLFACEISEKSPKVSESHQVLFVGHYGHPPNEDAAIWLAKEIFPLILRGCPAARLVLAGSDPTPAILSLSDATISVPGRLSDEGLAQLYAASRVAVAPLRFGAGVKGKVIEALSMGLPIVTTEFGVQGIPGLGEIVPVESDAQRYADAVVRLLTNDEAWFTQSQAELQYVSRVFSFDAFSATLLAAIAA